MIRPLTEKDERRSFRDIIDDIAFMIFDFYYFIFWKYIDFLKTVFYLALHFVFKCSYLDFINRINDEYEFLARAVREGKRSRALHKEQKERQARREQDQMMNGHQADRENVDNQPHMKAKAQIIPDIAN